MSPGRSEQRVMDSPVLSLQTRSPTGAQESGINQSLGWDSPRAVTRQEGWKARDHKTVCGPSCFISSWGQREKMFGRQTHLNSMDKPEEAWVLKERATERGWSHRRTGAESSLLISGAPSYNTGGMGDARVPGRMFGNTSS